MEQLSTDTYPTILAELTGNFCSQLRENGRIPPGCSRFHGVDWELSKVKRFVGYTFVSPQYIKLEEESKILSGYSSF